MERLAAVQREFHAKVAKVRAAFEAQLAVARRQRSGGAQTAKKAIKTCVEECERLRAKYLPAMRAKAGELAQLSGASSAASSPGNRQLSRLFLAHWENIERDAMDVFNRLLDVDEEVVHGGGNVDLSALHALVEEVRGCGAAGSCAPLDLDEFLVPKEISLLRKATFSSRLGEGGWFFFRSFLSFSSPFFSPFLSHFLCVVDCTDVSDLTDLSADM